MGRILHSLHFKIGSGVIVTIVLLSALYLIWDHRFYRRQLLDQLRHSATDISNVTLQSVLELAMAGRHPELLQQAVEKLGEGSSIIGIYVLDISGTVRFSSNPGEVGRRFKRDDDGCRECRDAAVGLDKTTVFYERREQEVLRNVRTVPNQKQCHSCHDPKQAINGILVVDLSTDQVQKRLRSSLYEVSAKGGLTLLGILSVVGLLMNRLVILRIKRLARGTILFAQKKQQDPDLLALEGPDEIGQLARSFNNMASEIRCSIQELENQRAYLQSLINSLQDGLVVVDPDFRIKLANRSAASVCDGKHLAEVLLTESSPETVSAGIGQAFQGKPNRTEISSDHQGQRLFFEVYFSPVTDREGMITRVIVLFREITERKQFEIQISRAERLASVGQLAAGLAHEINNPMAAISTCVEGLAKHLESVEGIAISEKEEIQDYFSTIGEAATRCHEITQRLLDASAERELDLQMIDLSEVAVDAISLIEYEARKRNVTLTTDFDSEIRFCGDRQKIHQLLLNLFLNSLEAISGIGHIRVSARKDRDFLRMEVADNGCGIPETHLESIFDPFFTTKRQGRGTGLGLSISERIVRQHQGQIYVTSKPGEGACFTILFPVGRMQQ